MSTRGTHSTSALTLGAIGVVFGDIGTSPLYAVRECFFGPHGIDPSPIHVLGIASLIIWSLILIISVKYLGIVLRADNQGEGGILALMALTRQAKGQSSGIERRNIVIFLGLIGAALLYGDGMITPAISVLSAVEGLTVVNHSLDHLVIPLTVTILILLFAVQRHGTHRLGTVFGPIMFVWFATLGILGVAAIAEHPRVLEAINPMYAIGYVLTNGWHGFLLLGSVFLSVTGGEAVYADMGHFGKRPIRFAWFLIAFPGLALNYLGQSALLLETPQANVNPFFLIAPPAFQLPLVILATIATVIASQALISGAFSLTKQAIQLGYLPRMEIRHTSSEKIGQIYVPFINYLLLVSTVLLVLGFGTSSNLAAAYGIAVSCTMLLTTMMVFTLMREKMGWSLAKSLSIVGLFLLLEAAFFIANALKILHGGWFPVLIGAVFFTIMTTWRKGRRIVARRLKTQSLPVDKFLGMITENPPHRVSGTSVFMTRNPDGIPPPLLHNVRHNKILHERVIIMTILNERIPYVASENRVEVKSLGQGFFRVTLHFGFMEKPQVLDALEFLRPYGLLLNISQTTFFLGSETLIPRDNNRGMEVWREHLFALMVRNAQKASYYFDLPPQQIIEVGLQVEL